MQYCRVLGIKVAATTMDEAVENVCKKLDKLRGQYVTFANVHAVVMATEQPDYKKAQRQAAVAFADGYPVASYQRRKGCGNAQRVAGPDFMAEIFKKSSKEGYRHYFYGSREETLARLQKSLEEKYPGMVIAGMYAPPFGQQSEEEISADIDRINAANADFVWIGLGAPKQELWMCHQKGKINAVMLGVGAGFDFHAGVTKRAPGWMQRCGMEWFYRLCKEPGRLFERYLRYNVKFLWKTILQRR